MNQKRKNRIFEELTFVQKKNKIKIKKILVNVTKNINVKHILLKEFSFKTIIQKENKYIF